MKSLAKNSIYNIIYTTVNIIFPLISSMYVSRVLMADGVGKVAYALNLASYFVILAALGIPVYGIRKIAAYQEDAEKTNQIFTQLFVINAISTVISSIAYVIFIYAIKGSQSDFILYLCAGLQLFFNFFNIDWFYKGKEEYGYITLRSILIKILSFIAILVFVKSKDDYIIYAIISGAALCGNYLFNIVHAFKFVRFDFEDFEIKIHMKPLLVLLAGIFLSTGYSMVDVTMLGSMGTDQAIGFYNNAYKAINIVVSACIAVSTAFLPRLSYYYAHDRKKMEGLVYFGGQIISFCSLPVTVIVVMLAPDIMQLLYGAEFVPASTALRLLAVLIIVKAFGDLFCYQLIMATASEKKRLPAAAIATSANILMNAILIPVWQENGAAVASVISEIIVNGYQFIYLRKIINILIPWKAFIQGIVASAIMGVGIYAFMLLLKDSLLRCILCSLIGGTIYIIMNRMMRNKMLEYGLGVIKPYLYNSIRKGYSVMLKIKR